MGLASAVPVGVVRPSQNKARPSAVDVPKKTKKTKKIKKSGEDAGAEMQKKATVR